MREVKKSWDVLSPRLQSVVVEIVRGGKHAEIAERLGLAVGTINYYITDIGKRWGVKGMVGIKAAVAEIGMPAGVSAEDPLVTRPPA